MAQFDESKFSAIDALFDQKGGGTTNSSAVSAAASDRTVASSSKRAGLGASSNKGTGSLAESSPSSASTRDIHKRLLQVGTTTSSSKKRRRHGEAYDSEGDEEEGEKNNGNHDDSDDDEQQEIGRTAIHKERPNPTAVENSETEPKMKKKKKKGKKEWQKEQEALANKSSSDSMHVETDATADTSNTATLDQYEKKLEESAAAIGDDGEDVHAGDQTATRKNAKKKRRKIRSRQKNIYKDKRDIKPDHLRVETTLTRHQYYQGRPLTAETRAKLGLPPSKSSSLRLAVVATASTVHPQTDSSIATNTSSGPRSNANGKQEQKQGDEQLEQLGEPVVDSKHDDNEAKLLLLSSSATTAETDSVNAKKKSQKKSKAKKPKYKNLV